MNMEISLVCAHLSLLVGGRIAGDHDWVTTRRRGWSRRRRRKGELIAAASCLNRRGGGSRSWNITSVLLDGSLQNHLHPRTPLLHDDLHVHVPRGSAHLQVDKLFLAGL